MIFDFGLPLVVTESENESLWQFRLIGTRSVHAAKAPEGWSIPRRCA
jgi:hypothetical protein